MTDKTEILSAIHRAIDETNKQLPAEKRLPRDGNVQLNTMVLDSLNMINFLLSVEETCQLDLGLEVDLGGTLSSGGEVPFGNVVELADYILRNSTPRNSP
jgi:hypothetical protein